MNVLVFVLDSNENYRLNKFRFIIQKYTLLVCSVEGYFIQIAHLLLVLMKAKPFNFFFFFNNKKSLINIKMSNKFGATNHST